MSAEVKTIILGVAEECTQIKGKCYSKCFQKWPVCPTSMKIIVNDFVNSIVFISVLMVQDVTIK